MANFHFIFGVYPILKKMKMKIELWKTGYVWYYFLF